MNNKWIIGRYSRTTPTQESTNLTPGPWRRRGREISNANQLLRYPLSLGGPPIPLQLIIEPSTGFGGACRLLSGIFIGANAIPQCEASAQGTAV